MNTLVSGKEMLPGPPAADEFTVGYQRPPRSGDFKPGQSGNPNGRPKGTRNTKQIIEEVLDRDTCIPGLIDPETGTPLSKHAAMIVAQTRKAEAGDTGAFNAVLDRLDGKATQAVEVGNIGEREKFERRLRAGETPTQIAADEKPPVEDAAGEKSQ